MEVEARKEYFGSASEVAPAGEYFYQEPNMYYVVQASVDGEDEEHWSVLVDLLDYMRASTSEDIKYSSREELVNLRRAYEDHIVGADLADLEEVDLLFGEYVNHLIDVGSLEETVDPFEV